MKKYRSLFILLNLIVLFGWFLNAVLDKEELLEDGQLILLELAPVDPRSLLQGDYMRLNYAISNRTGTDSISKRGFCVVKLEENGVAKKVRFQKNRTPIHPNEYLIEYTSQTWQGVNIGAESFFFEEGTGERYENATYGGIKVNEKGNSLLIGLYDKNRKKIE